MQNVGNASYLQNVLRLVPLVGPLFGQLQNLKTHIRTNQAHNMSSVIFHQHHSTRQPTEASLTTHTCVGS